jgi:probable F420-dependent oxidoreductase
MQFMFQYPEVNGPDRDFFGAGSVLDLARAAEAAGFGGFAFTEHPIPGARWLGAGGHQTLDPFVALGYVAAATTELRLLTYLAVAPYRNPSLLAKAAATVDVLSGGRCILGVGTGYLKTEFFALGVDFEERNALFDEMLDVLPLHWRGEPFSYAGRHFDARDVIALPRPVQDPIPIWIGGNARITRRRVAERAQGWMPMSGPPELSVTTRTPQIRGRDGLADAISEVRDMAGPRGATLDVVVAYDDPSIARIGVDVSRHRDALAELEAIGVTWVALSAPSGDPAAALDHIAGIGEHYIRP